MRLLPILFLWALIDMYAFRAVHTASSGLPANLANVLQWAYWLIDGLLIVAVLYYSRSGRFRNAGTAVMHPLMALAILSLVPKLVMIPFLAFEDVFRGIHAVINWLRDAPGPLFSARLKLISQIALAAAAIPFLGILYGVWRGRYDYTVRRITLKFKDLPEAFNGFSITQLSDIHSGSFTNAAQVDKGIALANAQNSDVILFTGDIVNNRAEELVPWVDHFVKLKAGSGKYSVLGNHDYGDYVQWASPAQKQANLDHLKQLHKQIGFRLLLNECLALEKNGQKINLIGVENWGARGFAQYGKLNAALQNVQSNDFNILLSHDPSHWEAQVLSFARNISLTLSGHTHGMQFGIEFLGIRWSPVQYAYKQWAGLYEKAGKYLYVNRGFGFIGFPGRVGILPEITVITLEKD